MPEPTLDLTAVEILVEGSADGPVEGELLVLSEPLSLWGGLDADTGRIIDARHPQLGASVKDRILALPHGRGSSSASAILLEAVRQRTGPAVIILRETDGILALGAAVAREMYGRQPAVLLVADRDFERLVTGERVRVDPSGSIRSVDQERGDQVQSTS